MEDFFVSFAAGFAEQNDALLMSWIMSAVLQG